MGNVVREVIIAIVISLSTSYGVLMASEPAIDSIPKYDLEILSYRYGKNDAQRILDGKIELGFTRSMAILAKGFPYEIEEPLGKYLDFEIFFYRDCTVFIEFGSITHIKKREQKK
jgi:hypothetical protein